MRTPAEFVVTRHLLNEPAAPPAVIAKRCDLRLTSASRAYKKIIELTDLEPLRLLRHLLDLRERPHWTHRSLNTPNPKQWDNRFDAPRWLSGEIAAARDGYNLVPERWLVYVLPEDLDNALKAAKQEYAKLAPAAKSNLIIRSTDPWMYLDPDSDLIELGQRLYDYSHSRHIQLTAELMHG